jgi:coenzyme F420 hydrogenase subunit beta
VKEGTTRAENYIFQAVDFEGFAGKPMYWQGLPAYLWHNSYFMHNACNYCDDVFGETADAVFMDAWLPQFAADHRGHTAVLVRNWELQEVFRQGIQQGGCHMEAIPVQELVQSQKGVIKKKRCLIKGKLYHSREMGRWVPKRRVNPDPGTYYKNWLSINLRSSVMNESKRLWPIFSQDLTNQRFWGAMKPWNRKLGILHSIQGLRRAISKVMA